MLNFDQVNEADLRGLVGDGESPVNPNPRLAAILEAVHQERLKMQAQQEAFLEKIHTLKMELFSSVCAAGYVAGNLASLQAPSVNFRDCAKCGVDLAYEVMRAIQDKESENQNASGPTNEEPVTDSTGEATGCGQDNPSGVPGPG